MHVCPMGVLSLMPSKCNFSLMPSRSLFSLMLSRCLFSLMPSGCLFSLMLSRCLFSLMPSGCLFSLMLSRCLFSLMPSGCLFSLMLSRCLFSLMPSRCLFSLMPYRCQAVLSETVLESGWCFSVSEVLSLIESHKDCAPSFCEQIGFTFSLSPVQVFGLAFVGQSDICQMLWLCCTLNTVF